MEFKGQLEKYVIDVENKRINILLSTQLNADTAKSLNEIKETDSLRVTIKKWREGRSNNANKYFHKLCSLIATAKTLTSDATSEVEIKNQLIADYGQKDYLDEHTPLILESVIPPDKALRLKEMHWQYNGVTGDGTYIYTIMRGSHTYDTREMAALIEGTISLAKDYNVETLPPDEVKRLISLWQPQKA